MLDKCKENFYGFVTVYLTVGKCNNFTMNILCWNIRGLGTTQKYYVLHDMIKDHNIDIIAI
jgi:hypothetical protein